MSDMEPNRRSLLLATPLLLAALAAGDKADGVGEIPLSPPPKTGPDPAETFVLPYQDIGFRPWGNLPPRSGEMAMLYGDFDRPGPYLVMMRWNPGWFSAPHTYATDRIQVVVSGTWFVNSGNGFAPQGAVPVGPGGYVKRVARTPHYDGVPAGQPDPAVIAVFGMGPVDMQLVDPTQPSWRQV
ncbi:tat pathway signal sequence [Mycobacterium sp. E342]|uniref:tat pathway signal sequence n=1 Tax=Mycobacterium sp. E342 TaxID=1834147 RepID=UPI000801E4C2|nr:tat pathway signal sequence [Mycobacterium sp. E342]OBH35872.1 tat pathway signal sequence [Mycobacterium sp. E342]